MDQRNARTSDINASLRLTGAIDRALKASGKPGVAESMTRRTAQAIAPHVPALPAPEEETAVEPTPTVNPHRVSLSERAEATIGLSGAIRSYEDDEDHDPQAGIRHLTLRRLAEHTKIGRILLPLEKDGDALAALDAYNDRREEMLSDLRMLDATLGQPEPAPTPMHQTAQLLPTDETRIALLEDLLRSTVHGMMDVPSLKRREQENKLLTLAYSAVAERRSFLYSTVDEMRKNEDHVQGESRLKRLERDLDVAGAGGSNRKPVPVSLIDDYEEEVSGLERLEQSIVHLRTEIAQTDKDLRAVLEDAEASFKPLKAVWKRLDDLMRVTRDSFRLQVPEDVNQHVAGISLLDREADKLLTRMGRDEVRLDVPASMRQSLDLLPARKKRLEALRAEQARAVKAAELPKPVLKLHVASDRPSQLARLGLIAFFYLQMGETEGRTKTSTTKRIFSHLQAMGVANGNEFSSFEGAMATQEHLFTKRDIAQDGSFVWRLKKESEGKALLAQLTGILSKEQREELFRRINGTYG